LPTKIPDREVGCLEQADQIECRFPR
jgi:hypothetical protein